MIELDHIPFLDNHVHAYPAPDGSSVGDPLTVLTLGGDDPDFLYSAVDQPRAEADVARLQDNVEQTMARKYARHLLAEYYGVGWSDLAGGRHRSMGGDPVGYVRRIYADSNLIGAVVDTGFPAGVDLDAFAKLTGLKVKECRRIERVIADLWDATENWEELRARFDNELQSAVSKEGVAAFKTIIAYRTGLAIEPVSQASAQRSHDLLRRSPGARGLLQRIKVDPELFLDVKIVRDALVWQAFEMSISLGVPFQIHTGWGDQDLDISGAEPGRLANVFRDRRLRHLKAILLHGSYPYYEQAAYLTNIFPNVYLDLSLLSPFLGGGAARVIRAILDLAPFTKLLGSTDAFGSAELHFVATRGLRRSLGTALEDAFSWSSRHESDLQAVASQILYQNAAALYQFDA